MPATAHAMRGSDVVRPLHSAMRLRARAVMRSRLGPFANHLSPIATMFTLTKTAMASAEAWDAALPMAPTWVLAWVSALE